MGQSESLNACAFRRFESALDIVSTFYHHRVKLQPQSFGHDRAASSMLRSELFELAIISDCVKTMLYIASLDNYLMSLK